MTDIVFYCRWCRSRLVAGNTTARTKMPCPVCEKNITTPLEPVWLPAINEGLREIVQVIVDGKLDFARGRLKLKKAIIAAGYHPGTALVEAHSPADLLWEPRMNLILGTQVDIARGFKGLISGSDPDVLQGFPAWEYRRFGSRRVPRNWTPRWNAAKAEAGDKTATNPESSGVMIARKDSGIWQALGNGAGGYTDTFGWNFAPFAFNSGMGMLNCSRSKAVALGVVTATDKIAPRDLSYLRPVLIPIEDERITEFLWNEQHPCDHCGKEVALRLIQSCDACGENICPECIAKGCSVPEIPKEPGTP